MKQELKEKYKQDRTGRPIQPKHKFIKLDDFQDSFGVECGPEFIVLPSVFSFEIPCPNYDVNQEIPALRDESFRLITADERRARNPRSK